MSQEAYLIGGVRTPFGRLPRRARRHAPRRPRRDRRSRPRSTAPGVPRDAVDEVIFGAANQAGEDNRNVARMAVLLAGLPRRGPRLHRQPALRVEPAGRRVGGAADPHRRGRRRRRRRRRVDDARAVVMAKPARGCGAPPEMADTTLGWRLVNPRMRDVDGGKATISLGETAEEVAGARRHHARGVRRVRPALAAAHGGRGAERARRPISSPVPLKDGERDRGRGARGRARRSRRSRSSSPSFRRGGIVTAGNASPLSRRRRARSSSPARRRSSATG